MSELTEKLAKLSPEQIKALAGRLRQRKVAATGAMASVPRDTAHFPLSFSQQRLWFLCQLAPDSVAYNNPVAARIRLEGTRSMDPLLLAEALNELVKRHESLRTTFELIDGEPMQVIAPSLRVPLRYLDLTATPAGQRELETAAILREDAQQPFDLAKGPLLRMTILCVDTNDYMLLINTHHLISDAWSVGVLLREMALVATAKKMGVPHLLPTLPVQYADFAIWQRRHLQGEEYRRLASYWTQKLAAPLPTLRLPLVRVRPSAPLGATHYSKLSPQLTQSVNAFARERGTTAFVVLLTAYKLLLRRYVREDDIVVGTPVANRTRSEIEGLIGCFINTLVLRTDLAGTGSFEEATARVGETAIGAFAHQDMPFELLVNELQPRRDLQTNPLFQTMFSLQNAPIEIDRAIQVIELDNASTKFDLTLTAMELNDELSLNWTYRADLIDAEAIERMAGHYRRLLTAALHSPQHDVASLSLMDAAEHERVVACQTSGACGLGDRNYVDWFDETAERWPDAAALRQEDQLFSYRQVRSAANALAHRLLDAGVANGYRVAVLFDRSPAMIVAMLGVLKAGAAFLPLDPAWPVSRAAKIMAIAEVRHAVIDPSLAERVPAAVASILLDANTLGTSEDVEPPLVPVAPDDLAYVIFTSGSSGEPKGVAVEHRQLARYVEGIAACMALPRGATYAAVSTLAADLAYTMVFPALVSGGCLLLASAAQMSEPQTLARWLTAHSADALKIVPSHLDALLELAESNRLLPRRVLVLGGEACPPTLLRKLADLRDQLPSGNLRVLNHYGPTETTVGVIAEEIDLRQTDEEGSVPLGRPLGEARIYICDDRLQLVPIGVPGELCIGGPIVARGYLTKGVAGASTAFQLDPYRPLSDARLYRSGDLGRLRADGRIEFLGRMDAQVKIRGFRVEPAELEATICAWPGARATVVKAIEHGGETKLVAWVVAATDADQAGLRAYLRERLIEAMQPSLITFVAALPLTPNGKIDRAALRADEHLLAASAANFVAPRTPTELALAQLWAKLLGRQEVGARDSFFDLGGHSLLAVRMIARVQNVFGVSVPLAALFENATVEQFARLIQQPAKTSPTSALVPIQPAGTRRPLFFVHPAGGNVLCYYQLTRELGTDQPFHGLQSVSVDAEEAGSISAMAAAYLDAIRATQPRGPYRLGGWSMGGVIAFEMAQQLRRLGEEVEWLGILDFPAPGGIQREDRDRIDDATALLIYARKVELFSGTSLGLDSIAAQSRSADELGEDLLEAMRDTQLVPVEVTSEHFRHFMKIQRAHNYASLNYQPTAYDGPLTVIRCEAPPSIRLEATLLRLDELYADESLGWAAFCTRVPMVHRVPGSHAEMMAPPHVGAVAAVIRATLP